MSEKKMTVVEKAALRKAQYSHIEQMLIDQDVHFEPSKKGILAVIDGAWVEYTVIVRDADKFSIEKERQEYAEKAARAEAAAAKALAAAEEKARKAQARLEKEAAKQ